MKTKQRCCLTVITVFSVLILKQPAYAGPYSDDLTRCIVESTTATDRIEFVKWMFVAMSVHPAVKSLSSTSEEQLESENKKTADLFMRLLTVSCREKAEKAIKYEGNVAIQTSFKILGQISAQELFANPDVAKAINGLEEYFDEEKLKSSLGIK